MTCINPYDIKKFDEVEFIKECACRFPEIRNKYQLDEDTLKSAKSKHKLEKMAEMILDGCTEQGILKIAKGMTAWEFRERGGSIFDFPMRFLWFRIVPNIRKNPTNDMVNVVSEYYESTCRALRRKIDELAHLEKVLVNLDKLIDKQEQRISSGDVKAMFFLGKIYEDEEFGVQNKEKANAYYQMAKDTWKEKHSKRYEEWLDKAVQDSGLELLREMGRAYIAGSFVQAGKKDYDKKLKKEIRWLTDAITVDDGWAAFTLGNIHYYGYGRCKQRKKAAYNKYLQAAQTKESIYALELGECQLQDGTISREICQALSDM